MEASVWAGYLKDPSKPQIPNILQNSWFLVKKMPSLCVCALQAINSPSIVRVKFVSCSPLGIFLFSLPCLLSFTPRARVWGLEFGLEDLPCLKLLPPDKISNLSSDGDIITGIFFLFVFLMMAISNFSSDLPEIRITGS